MKLLPEDFRFIEIIQQEISEHCAVPLVISPERIKTIIKDCAEWFYEWHPNAVQRNHYLIKYDDILKAREGKFASTIKVPEAIKFVFRVRKADGGFSKTTEARYLRNPLYAMNRFMGSMHTRGMSLNGGVQGRNFDMVQQVISLYEFQTLHSISSANRGVAHDFSEFSNEITFLSNVTGDIMLECGVRVPITELYSNHHFKMYVKGFALQSLSRILGTFDYKYIGDVAINFDALKTDGEKLEEKVESEIKGFNSSSFIMTR
ncbi:hypothetical protein BPT24_177 [Tenacibaculum phage pT24]|uniref:Uncharacterized protein n=1 Tax=Tenacibaculum phage pT24 TaxID=1880590 RepID=A0A1B4XWV5_9CAUD|nr:hypothetical protein HYP10_gp177 [Tenacibaculum phage pT24]BAV39302.1 hypothetical protein BPT24_177 [Tenacibaculum phage pT24]